MQYPATYEEYHVIPPKNPNQQGPDIYNTHNDAIMGNQGRTDSFMILKATTTYTVVSMYNNGPGTTLPLIQNPPVFVPKQQTGVYQVRGN